MSDTTYFDYKIPCASNPHSDFLNLTGTPQLLMIGTYEGISGWQDPDFEGPDYYSGDYTSATVHIMTAEVADELITALTYWRDQIRKDKDR